MTCIVQIKLNGKPGNAGSALVGIPIAVTRWQVEARQFPYTAKFPPSFSPHIVSMVWPVHNQQWQGKHISLICI